MSQEKILRLNIVLKGDVARKFQQIKKMKGLTNNTELVRLLLSEWEAKQ